MPRIAIAGFQHETNTFGATLAHYADFELANSWPGLLQGAQVIPGTLGSNLPLAGFVRQAQQDPSVELIPIVWCSAEPCSFVTDDAFDRISGMILDGVAQAGALDGIYLDLYGAMVTQSHQDGEGELLRRLHAQVGPDLPISISLDLHANLTARMVDLAASIDIFRTYPHLDMADSGGRAFTSLMYLIGGGRLCKAYRQGPYLIPLHAQFTGLPPFRDLYAATAAIGPAPTQWAEFAAGFPAADIFDAGPAILAYAPTQLEADRVADTLLSGLIAAEPQMNTALLSPADAVARAMSIHRQTGQPVVIVDVQDNPGAGGTSDTTGLLRALVEDSAGPVALAMLNDPQMAALAHTEGVGAQLTGSLGGTAGPHPDSFEGQYLVEALSDGKFPFSGQMYAGSIADTGPTAVLRVLHPQSEVRVVVSSQRCQALDLAVFEHIGIDPAAQRILAVKSTVHFRAAFDPIAAATLACVAPGLHPCQLTHVPYKNLRPGVRLEPLGPVFEKPV